MAQVEYRGTGRRKNSVARVRLVPGEGNITVNGRDVRSYLPFESLILDINQAFDVTETKGNYDVLVNVQGGGFTGQAQAIRHGISRALLEADPEYRGSLKRAGLLTRDPRMKERKNQVLKKLVVHHNSQNVNITETVANLLFAYRFGTRVATAICVQINHRFKAPA